MNTGSISRDLAGMFQGIVGTACVAALALMAASARGEEDLLRPEDAFRYHATATDDTVVVDWEIAPGYYLYRSRMSYASRTPGVTLGAPEFSQGKIKEDEFFGKQEIYHDSANIRIPYTRMAADADHLTLELKVQGCADAGICYPPQTWTTDVALQSSGGGTSSSNAAPPAGAPAGKNLLQELARDPEFGDSAREFLPPDEAFVFSAEMADPYTIRAHWDIADGYYLYRSKFGFDSTSKAAQLGAPALPAGSCASIAGVRVLWSSIHGPR